MSIVEKAAKFAAKAHSSQKRKYTGEPYFVHCAEVANLVRENGGCDEMVAAAYLHDTVEDCGVSITKISSEFGLFVAKLVSDLTDVSKPSDGNRAKRKEIDRNHIKNACMSAKIIKLADLISNTRSISTHDPDFAVVYLEEKALILKEAIKRSDVSEHPLWDLAFDTIIEARRTLGPKTRLKKK